MKIARVSIELLGNTFIDAKASVQATFEDGSSKAIFCFYPDEISIDPLELVGLTEPEAIALHRKKDRAFLQGMN